MLKNLEVAIENQSSGIQTRDASPRPIARDVGAEAKADRVVYIGRRAIGRYKILALRHTWNVKEKLTYRIITDPTDIKLWNTIFEQTN